MKGVREKVSDDGTGVAEQKSFSYGPIDTTLAC